MRRADHRPPTAPRAVARRAPVAPVAPAEVRPSGWRALLPGALVVAAGLFAWWGVWAFDFKFDDNVMRADPALVHGDWWGVAFGERHQPLSNRPLACLSLALDHALWGPGPFGPHLGNVVLHLVNALLVLALARAALRA